MQSRSSPPSPSPRYPWLYALAGGKLPASVTCGGREFTLVSTFKHDFFAATGLYRDAQGLAVLKLNRANDLCGLPLRWIGRFLGQREARLYRIAAGLPGVPTLIGTVGDTGFMHTYVAGRPLERREWVPDRFFPELRTLLAALHARHVAYVDLNKRENVLVGDDGRPYLIDFQISLHMPPVGWRGLRPMRWLLARFQRADIYHYLKHKRRSRPDLLTPDDERILGRLSIWIRLHRWLARPLTHLRRRALRRLKARETVPVAGSSAK